MEADYPWGLDAETKPTSKKECQEVVEAIVKLRGVMKNFRKRNDPRKERALEMYRTMVQKSADFRAQPGQRYTKKEEEEEASGIEKATPKKPKPQTSRKQRTP